MSGNNPGTLQLATVAFSTGINANGTLDRVNGWDWNGDTPATFGAVNESAHKWGGGAAATNGGTVTYAFDTGSDWTPAEQGIFTAGLALWSDEANIAFVQAPFPLGAELTFYRYGTATAPSPLESGAYETDSYSSGNPGDSTVPATQSAYISIDTGQPQWSDLSSFTYDGGYGPQTVVHEEGHAIGLMHTGPYNGNVNPATEQWNATDTRLWSIMSYIQPNNAAAKYYASYPVTGTQWNGNYPTTPMALDILGAQRIYGMPAATPLSGGQIFGFNCNVAGAAEPFFDFTKNTNPVITIWDEGGNNTLDLGGFATASIVNLNAGSFSSADGMTNNICIAYGTTIDTAIGSGGGDTFYVNPDNDTIYGQGSYNTVVFPGDFSDYGIVNANGTVTVTDRNVGQGGTDTLTDIQLLEFADQAILACFAAGTRILTGRGEIPVEALREGDAVATARGDPLPIVWLGHRRVDCRRHPRPDLLWPVCVRAGAFAHGLPARDLWLSPDHAVFSEHVLIPIKHLVNGASIEQVPLDEVSYWHVELPRHAVIRAEGLPVESYLDTGNRAAFANGARYLALHPDFFPRSWDDACAPLCTSGAPLTAARRALLARAAQLPPQPADPHLLVAGRTIRPAAVKRTAGGRLHRFLLPAGSAMVRIVPPGAAIAGIVADGKLLPRNGDSCLLLPPSPRPMLLDLLLRHSMPSRPKNSVARRPDAGPLRFAIG